MPTSSERSSAKTHSSSSRMATKSNSGIVSATRLEGFQASTSDANVTEVDDIGVLRYEELSDGEQMVLGRMALFHLLQGQQDALLLLDEPETHFNDKWKREIVDIIDDAIGHTSNDVLISTHSAIVLSDVFNNEIVMVAAYVVSLRGKNLPGKAPEGKQIAPFGVGN